MKKVIIFLMFLLLVFIVGCNNPNNLSESSPEYQKMVYERFKMVATDPDISHIKVDGSLLYINFIKPQSVSEYNLVAKMNAVQFSNFKKSKLGVSGVTVYVTFNNKIVTKANARYGKVTK